MSVIRKVTVVDYGIGNVYSVCQAIRNLGGEPVLTADKQSILAADRLVLPGVGAFSQGMQRLARKGLDEVVKRFCETGRPFLGICLGMQMLMERSSELGQHDGLSIIPGRVERLAAVAHDGTPHKVPHIAWAPLFLPKERTEAFWEGTILKGIKPGQQTFYFVHSYAVCPTNQEHALAESEYDGIRFTAAVCKDNVLGTQFHPERSGPAGLQVFRNFMRL